MASEESAVPVLTILNSFSRKKEKFVPLNGKTVTWYCCGPTVYDSAHMGHARAYITFDIIKRIMRDYFSYDIFAVMNITDIDDKIIKRARQNYLFDKYKLAAHPREKIIEDISTCKENLRSQLEKETDPDVKFKLENIKQKLESLNLSGSSTDDLANEAKDGLVDLLDSLHGHEVNDSSLFEKLPRFYEADYFDDMKNLGIETPDVLVRVTEYVPEIVSFIQGIIQKGFAYESNKSVYFDVDKFSQHPDHNYAKLVPEALGDEQKLKEGEGGLSSTVSGEKRSPRDFALWKNSKPGEPRWPSPWGQGRPGWHIECSVMASDILGKSIDIHGGGVDLKFPHHDNEVAQSEAYFGNDDWIRYFLHSGHLHIEGRKMSKSLKNFITIKDALKTYTATQIRLLFLLHEWSSTLDYSYETMKEALTYEKYLSEFFLAVKDVLRADSDSNKFKKITEAEKKIYANLTEAKRDIHSHLCDSFNTPKVMYTIRNLVSAVNSYLSKNSSEPNYALLRAVSTYITDILRIFGVVRKEHTIGFAESSSGADVENLLIPFLDTLANFREEARQRAFAMIKSCDELRDRVLPDLGVRFEDKPGQKSVIKYVGKEVIEQERRQAEELAARKAAEKEAQKKRQEELVAQKDAQNRVNPEEMFRGDSSKYSKFDERGIPTHTGDGSEITESQRKKLVKQFEQQKQKYDKYLKETNQAK